MAIQQAWSLGLDCLVFEGDCKTLINILHDQQMDFNIENICWDISKWAKKFRECNFQFTIRQNNVVAHALASKGPENSIFFSSRANPPLWLSDLLYSDYVTCF